MTGVFGSRFGPTTALVVTVLALAATVAVLAPVPGPARATAVLGFALIGPGATIAALLGIRAAAPWAMVTVTGSIAVGVLTTEFAAIASWWEPRQLLPMLAALCSVAALWAWRRDLDTAVTS